MPTHATSPYANTVAVQTAVLQPPATQPAQQTAAARRSFRSFVEAMDDFSGDRRDVAGMRQILAMQDENQRAVAARPVPVASSFAPDQGQPEVPVVRGPVQGAGLPRPNPANVLPSLPTAAPIQSSALPQPNYDAVQTSALPSLPVAENSIPKLVIDPAKINPGAGHIGPERIVAYMPTQPSALATPAVATDQSLPQPLRSPLVDQMREATRTGTRPGLTDDTMARFAAASDRKRSASAPMPPRLMAQEARWNRDAWQATVRASGVTPPTTTASAEPASVLPRLPTAPTIQ